MKQKKILVFENDPQYFDTTGLIGYLTKEGYSWDFAMSLDWEFTDLINVALDLVTGKYDVIATETGFGYSKKTTMDKDKELEGGQLKEMLYVLDAILPKRKNKLKVIVSQRIGDWVMDAEEFKSHLLESNEFVRFSSLTRRVLEHPNMELIVINEDVTKR